MSGNGVGMTTTAATAISVAATFTAATHARWTTGSKARPTAGIPPLASALCVLLSRRKLVFVKNYTGDFMSYCSNCGNELNEGAEFCSKCGSAVAAGSSVSIQQSNSENHRVNNGDAPSGGFAFLGFLFPLVGLILYLVWRESFPLKANSCGKGALVSVVIGVVLTIISNIIL